MKRGNRGFSIILICIILAVLFFTSFQQTYAADEAKLQMGQVPMNVNTFLGDNVGADVNRLKNLPRFLYRTGVATAFVEVLKDWGPNNIRFVNIRYKRENLSSSYRSKEKVDLLQRFYNEYDQEEEGFLKKIAVENKCNIIIFWQPLDYNEIIENGNISLELAIYDVLNNVSQTGFVELDKKLWSRDKEQHQKKIIEQVIELVESIKAVLRQGVGE